MQIKLYIISYYIYISQTAMFLYYRNTVLVPGQKRLAVQLLFTNQLSQNVRSNLKTCLKNWAGKHTDFRIHDTESDIDKSKPLVVVCLSVSRLESDIDNELSQLKITDGMLIYSRITFCTLFRMIG